MPQATGAWACLRRTLTALAAGDYTITAALTDKAGNSNSATHGVEVNLTAPVLTIDTVSGDDAINNAEKTQDLTISGTASGLAAGAVVTVMLNGKAYSAQVDDNGKWTTTVPANEVGQLGEALLYRHRLSDGQRRQQYQHVAHRERGIRSAGRDRQHHCR